jgi:hypothetical protein
VQLTCKLPADLAQRLRDRAVTVEGGVNAILAEAVGQWLESAAGATGRYEGGGGARGYDFSLGRTAESDQASPNFAVKGEGKCSRM